MNSLYEFNVTIQPAPGTRTPVGEPNPPQQIHLAATGSQETRARRRLLGAVYDAGATVCRVECTGSQPVK